VMIRANPASNRNGRRNSNGSKGLDEVGGGWKPDKTPPSAPKPEAVFSHIHPWIFSTL
jgi:hypothetical protein